MKTIFATLLLSATLAGCCSGIDCAPEAKLVCEGETTRQITGRYGVYDVRASCTKMYYTCIEPLELVGDSDGNPVCTMPKDEKE